MLEPPKEEDTGKQYCLKTKKGKCYYGTSPVKVLAAYYNDLAIRSPLTIRKLIGRRYNDIGMVVLHAEMPKNGGIQLSNPTAYLSSDLNERSALSYAVWLCRKSGELDEPVSLSLIKEPRSLVKPTENRFVSVKKKTTKEVDKQDNILGSDERAIQKSVMFLKILTITWLCAFKSVNRICIMGFVGLMKEPMRLQNMSAPILRRRVFGKMMRSITGGSIMTAALPTSGMKMKSIMNCSKMKASRNT